MSDFLALIARNSERRAAEAKQREKLSDLRTRALEMPNCPRLELHRGCFDIIAEVKRHAPSVGALSPADAAHPDFVGRQAEAYVRGGAAVISVLTEPETFHGSLEDLTAAARAVPIPIMRKDFLVDPYQVIEARAAGAAGVLLILRMLDDAHLGEMLDAAGELGLFVILEAFDQDDLARARQVTSATDDEAVRVLVGLNSRNLVTLEVDDERLARLARAFPDGLPRVAESGLETPADVARVAALGYSLALVGTALMKASNPTRLTADMIEAGRIATMKQCASA